MHLRLLFSRASLAAAVIFDASVLLTSGADDVDVAAGPLLQPSKPCGKESYNPDEYVCRNKTLCPIVNGEPLSLCGRACFSQYLYTCRGGNGLRLRPPLRRGTTIALRAENPQDGGGSNGRNFPPSSPRPGGDGHDNKTKDPVVDGKPMTACRLAWNVGGTTCSYCPVPQVDPDRCPAGNVTALSASGNAMDVVVPGGQRFFLTEDWTVGYTQAHSALMPNGSTTAGFRTFAGGGFFNLLDGAWGWAACGQEERKRLHVRNSTNEDELKGCVGLNLRIDEFEDVGAWQYA